MLCQFEEAGLIDRIRAIAFGEFYHCGPDEKAPYEWTVKEVLRAYAKKWGKPAYGRLCDYVRHEVSLALKEGREIE